MAAGAWGRHGKPISGVLYLVLIGLLVWASIATFEKKLPWQGAATITLRTASPGLELNPHSDVKFDGVRVGEVRSITSDGRTARIELALQHDKLRLIPANVDAAIVPKTLFGEKFVDLRLPSHPSGARLAAGGVIGQSTTSVEIGALFSDLVPVLDALKPQQLSIILSSLAQALDGRGATLARDLNQFTAFLRQVDPHLGTFTHDVDQFTRTADIYAASAPDLTSLLSSAAGISRELLVPQEKSFSALLDQVSATSGETQQVLAHNAENLIRLSGRSRAVLQVLDDYSTALPCLFTGLHRFSIISDQAIGARGPFTNLVIDVISDNGPYKNPEDLPSNPHSDGNNANLPFGIPNWKPHCAQFSPENLALNDAAPNSMPLAGTAIDAPQSSDRSAVPDAVPDAAVQEALAALARALAAHSLGVPPAQVPGYAELLIAPMLTDGTVSVR